MWLTWGGRGDGKYSAAHISVATGALLISTDLLLLKHKDLKAFHRILLVV